jgi:hypothetical protein
MHALSIYREVAHGSAESRKQCATSPVQQRLQDIAEDMHGAHRRLAGRSRHAHHPLGDVREIAIQGGGSDRRPDETFDDAGIGGIGRVQVGVGPPCVSMT